MTARPWDHADRAAQAIVHDISDRRGLKWEWRQIDPGIRRAIRRRWAELIREAEAHLGVSPLELHLTQTAVSMESSASRGRA